MSKAVQHETIKREKLVKEIAELTHCSKQDIYAILNAISIVIRNHALEVTKEKPCLRLGLFKYFSIYCKYVPQRTMPCCGLDHKETVISPRIDVQFRIREQTKQDLFRLPFEENNEENNITL